MNRKILNKYEVIINIENEYELIIDFTENHSTSDWELFRWKNRKELKKLEKKEPNFFFSLYHMVRWYIHLPVNLMILLIPLTLLYFILFH